MMPFSLFLALKYLKPERSFISVVTAISVAGVALGVAILVIVMSVMNGFGNMWREKILSFKPHITVSAQSGVLIGEDALCRRLDALPGVVGVAPAIETKVMMQYRGVSVTPILIGVDPDRAKYVSNIASNIAYGKYNVKGSRVVVGIDIATYLGLYPGNKALVYSPMNLMSRNEMYLPSELNVSGVFNMGMRDYDGGFVITSLEAARELVGLDRGVHSVYVMMRNPEDTDAVDRMAAVIRRELGPGYIVRSWLEVDSMLFNALFYEKSMMFVLLAFIFVVAIFCVTNTLIVVIVQKTNEIGLLKAIGFSSGQVMSVFVWHGWIQCMLGSLTGMGLGLLVVSNLGQIVHGLARLNVKVFPKEIYGLDRIPAEVSSVDMTIVLVMVFICCTLASVLAAFRAARLKPAEALRQE